MTATATNVVPYVPEGIAVYNEFRAQLSTLQEENAKTIFQYADPKGNAAARSYVYKLRQTKAAVDRARKEEKAASLEYGRRVDAEAKEIMEAIESMIDVHQRPLDEIEQREKDRVAGIRARIAEIARFEECRGYGSEDLKMGIATLKQIVIDASFAEFQPEAALQRDTSIRAQEAELAVALQREAEQAELARLRQEAAEREQKEREDRIRREEAERVQREADAKAKAEREASERRERELREAAERSEKERIAAEQRAEDAARQERERVQREADAKAAEDARREADRMHQAAIHAGIIAALGPLGIGEELAKSMIIAIRGGAVPNLKIIY